MKVLKLGWFMLLAMVTFVRAAPVLTLSAHGKTISLNAKTLQKLAGTQPISIHDDAAYHHDMAYQAVPLATLLLRSGVVQDDEVLFVAADGFAVTLPAAQLLQAQPDHAQAWLAIEPASPHWPKLAGNSVSAGPYYVVWTHPELDAISPEQWPYQVVHITVQAPLAKRWPALVPVDGSPQARHGFAVLAKHCLACHTLNLAGDARLGPDLNVPMNPVEYFREGMLRRYIRNPQDLRSWPTAKMPSFDEKTLNEADLADLIAYLSHMATLKVPRVASVPAQPTQ